MLEVEQGGTGAGTRIRFQMRVGGATRTFQAEISEPDPGRMLVESNHDANDPSSTSVTTFKVEPISGGKHSHVTITTEMAVHSGLAGIMEKLFAPSMIRKVYQQELSNLEASAVARAAGLSAKSATA
jgi:uncharacterized protein YndB with AHSA1/START domain